MSLNAILIVDTQGVVRHWNEDAEKNFGYNTSQITGKSMELLIAESYRERH